MHSTKAALAAFLILLAAGCSSDQQLQLQLAPPEVTEHLVLKQVLLAASSAANLPLIISAGSRHDLEAIDAMEADGRLVLLSPETIIESRHSSTSDQGTVAVISVLSGKLVGKQFYAYQEASDFSKDSVDDAMEKYRPKTNDEMWIRMGGGLIQLEKQGREIERLQERAKKLPK